MSPVAGPAIYFIGDKDTLQTIYAPLVWLADRNDSFANLLGGYTKPWLLGR